MVYFSDRTHVRKAIVLLFVLILSACSQKIVKQPSISDSQLAYEIRQERISQVSSWKIRARISIKTESDSNTANMNWQQQSSQVHIKLQGPFGISVAEINGKPGGYTLRDKQGQLWLADNIDELIFKRTGWILPVAKLRYWLLADTQNKNDALFVYNTDGTLQSLRYQEWQIDYQKYTNVNDISLPTKISIAHPDVNIKLAIRKWDLQDD